ncbi:death-associated inhibitor of apoptosis 2-like isoform X2 [Neocloeon triangulifer]|uniref:death-associated inhibitor of apoptosis 2-like isoform X2 n=1 Tax=Neocloeon triangulifer TaxID=2078957 RepID=UPI00286ECEDB|nr:death-associated inhibitor of apoptosis 2-like isoform X2 [Neocloeon triangulifer]
MQPTPAKAETEAEDPSSILKAVKMTSDQAPIHIDRLLLGIALHRLFTFPPNFKKRFALDQEVFAEAGYYCQNSNRAIRLRCHFCSSEISKQEIRNFGNLDAVKNFVAGKNCPVKSDDSDNVPLNVKQLDNFKFESHRLYSLLKKDDWQFVTPADLAADGFYYEGVDDNCRCRFCNLGIRGWEVGDQVRSQHLRWNADCPFLRNPNSVQNIPIGHEQVDIMHDAIGEKKMGTTTFPTNGGAQGVENANPPDVGPPLAPAPPEGDNNQN